MNTTTQGVRYAEVERETGEVCVRVVVDLDGGTRRDISTGIGFFDHMLEQLAFHGQVDLGIQAEGDLPIDDHHTVEEVGGALGEAIRDAIGVSHIARFASNHTPKDDALILAAVDISGRGQLHYDVPFTRERIGGLSTEAVREFFQAFAATAGLTLHLRKEAGLNDHHVCEALFKGVGLALLAATRGTERRGPASTRSLINS